MRQVSRFWLVGLCCGALLASCNRVSKQESATAGGPGLTAAAGPTTKPTASAADAQPTAAATANAVAANPGAAAAAARVYPGQSGKLALLVGINGYQFDQDIPNLEGTSNDVDAMQDVLVRRYGFAPGNIVVLKDADASREAILRNLRQHLIARADANTVAIFYYSGHGSQQRDVNGDEPDGWDETIVPWDSGRSGDRPNRDISDDELNALVGELGKKTPHVALVLDSCHSGTGVRMLARARKAPRDERGAATGRSMPQGVDTAGGFRDASSYVLISGALASELSYEHRIGEKMMGALTWSLARALWQTDSGTTYRDVMDRAAAEVTATFSVQHPQIEGLEKDTLVFGRERPERPPYVLVSKDGSKLMLGAGAVQGVQPGSTFAIYPASARDYSAPALAKVETTTVGVTRSEVRLIEGSAVADGSHAVEVAHDFQASKLRVFVRDAQQAEPRAVAQLLAKHRHIALVPKGADAQLEVGLEAQGFVLKNAVGTALSRPIPKGAGAGPLVVDQVLKWAKWFSVLRIENDASATSTPPLNVGFSLVGGKAAYAARDEVKVRLTNNTATTLFFSVLDIASDGSVSVAFAPGANETLAAGGRWEHAFPVCLMPGVTTPVQDVLKVFVATETVDLSLLEQDKIEPTKGVPSSSLADLLETMAFGKSKNVARPERTSIKGWATRQVSFSVVPKAGAKPCTVQ